LEDYLRDNPDTHVEKLVHFAKEIAVGMAHLSSFIVHRDLATRNVLLAAAGPPYNMTAKITDFGLSRPIQAGRYYHMTRAHTQIPYPWLPNEVFYNQFIQNEKDWKPHTPASDVYMFASTVWYVSPNQRNL
jgi:serine/threonine protein kinase